jgi:hypothetical protein
MNLEPCPLCGQALHEGKCPKPPRGKYWCGLCLIDRLSPEDLQAPALPSLLLLTAGIERTTAWCHRCGSSICSHHTSGSQNTPRCATDDCRARPEAKVALLRATLEKYNPGYSNGPARCRACGLPAYRRRLCQRHYNNVRAGHVHLLVDRQRKYRGHTVKPVVVYLNDFALAEAKRLAGLETLSKWVSDLVAAEIKRKTGVDVVAGHTVFNPAASE